jgi:signal peptidase I
MADIKNQGKTQAQGESWTELAKTVIYAGLIAIVIRTFLFQPFNIPSGSMENTLMIGDYLFVEKFSYGYSRYTFPFGGWPFGDSLHGRYLARDPHRGDVVVFKFPGDNSTDYIKRLIGLPGDRVQMINDILYLNGKPVQRDRETLPGGKSYVTIDKETDGALDNTGVFVVPPKHYFMMGDNRDNSNDSRMEVGYVPEENLEGKAEFRFFSIDDSVPVWQIWRWPLAIRYSRLLTPIN